MKVKRIKNYLTDEEKKLIGMSLDEYSVYNITEGCRYTVLAISFMYEQYGVLLDIKDDLGFPYLMPMCLFEIVDRRPSALWQIESRRKTSLSLSAPFYKRYLHDELIEGDPKAVEAFSKAVALLEKEFFYTPPEDKHVSANKFRYELKHLIDDVIDDVKINKWDYQKLSDVMADLIAKIKPAENPLHSRVLDAWAVIFNQSLDTPSDKISSEHIKIIEGILTK